VGDRLVLVFQPTWPLVLAASDALSGSFLPALAVRAALVVVLLHLFATELTGSRRVGLLAAGVGACSPFLWLHGATFLAYLLSFALELAFGTLLLRALRTGRRRSMVGAGLALGAVFVTRPFDALLLAGLTAVWLLVRHRRSLRGLLRDAGWLSVGGLPGALVAMAYNAAVTGHPLRFALHAAGGANAFGFGRRRIAVGTPVVEVGLDDALWAMAHNLTELLPRWLFGGWLSPLLAVVGLWLLRRNRRALVVCLVVVAAFPLANLAYWGNILIARHTDYLGPLYYLPLLAPFSVAAGVALDRALERRRVVAVAAVPALAVLTALAVSPSLQANLRSRDFLALDRRALAEASPDDAIVLLAGDGDRGWIGHPFPSLLNDAALAQEVLFAVDRGPRSLGLLHRFPERRLWRLERRLFFSEHGVAAEASASELHRLVGRQLRIRARVRNRTGARTVSMYVTDGTRIAHWVLDGRSRRGADYDAVVTARVDGRVRLFGVPGARLVTDTMRGHPLGSGTLAVGAGFTPGDRLRGDLQEARFPFRRLGVVVETVAPGECWRKMPRTGRRWLRLRAPGLALQVGDDRGGTTPLTACSPTARAGGAPRRER